MFGGRAFGTRELASGRAGISSTDLIVILGGQIVTDRMAADGLQLSEVLNGRVTASIRLYQQRPSLQMNLLKRSQEFNNSAWTKTRSSISADATTAPDGTTTADKLVEDATAANTHFVLANNVPDMLAGRISTLSVYIKAAERSIVQIYLQSGDSADQFRYEFNLGTQVVTQRLVTGTGSSISGSMTDAGSGWYRCVMTGIHSATAVDADVRILLCHAVNDPTYDGDGTSGLYLWGAQLELSDLVTTYLPTTSVAIIDRSSIASVGQSLFVLTGLIRRFAGIVSQVQEVQYFEVDNAQHWIELNIEAIDYNDIPARFFITSKVYASKTAGYIVTDLINSYLLTDNISADGVSAGSTITNYEIIDKSVAEVFDDLSDITGFIWSISAYKAMNFLANEFSTAPFNLSSTSGDVRQVRTRRSRDQYRNVQIVRGSGSVLETRTDTTAINERQAVEGGSGRYENLTSDNSAATAAQAQALGDGLLARYAQLDTEVEFETHRDGLRPGQRITLTFTDLNISGTFLITQVDWEILAAPTLLTRSRVLASSGEVRSVWLTFWKHLLERI